MTFPTELERLLRDATDTQWQICTESPADNPYWKADGTEITSDHGRIADFGCSGLRSIQQCKANASISVLLRNHAPAILELVRAAQTYADEYAIAEDAGELAHWPEGETSRCKAIADALAKLNGGKG